MTNNPNDDDRELFKAWTKGDRRAGEQLVRKHYGTIRTSLPRTLSDDAAREITQEVFLVACEKHRKQEPPECIIGFLKVTARYKVLEYHRRIKKSSSESYEDGIIPKLTRTWRSFSSRLHDKEQLKQAQKIFQDLPTKIRMIVRKGTIEGKSSFEIGTELNLSPSYVRKVLSQFRALLRRIL